VLLPKQPAALLLWGRALATWSLAMDEHGGHKDLHDSCRWSVIPSVHGRTELYCSSLPCLSALLFLTPCEVVSTRAFYISRSGSYNESQGPTGGLKTDKTLCCRAQRLGVANDVFCTASAAWSHPVSSLCCTEHGLHYGAVLSGRITTVAMSRSGQLGQHCTIEPHCSGLHILQVLR
jgi:hypothetical protein